MLGIFVRLVLFISGILSDSEGLITVVRSRLDYCNSLFRSLSALNLHRRQCVQNHLARIVASVTKYSYIIPVRKTQVVYQALLYFQDGLLVSRLLQNGYLKYFEPIPRHNVYKTRRGQSNGVMLDIQHFASIYKYTKHFALRFLYDAPVILNELPDDGHLAKSLYSFRKKLKTYLSVKTYPP